MNVIKASLQRAEKNNIREAIREFKEQKIQRNIINRNTEKTEHIKTNNEMKMEKVNKKKQMMSAEMERKRQELIKKENEQMAPIRAKFNMTQSLNRTSYPKVDHLRNSSSALFKMEPTEESPTN